MTPNNYPELTNVIEIVNHLRTGLSVSGTPKPPILDKQLNSP